MSKILIVGGSSRKILSSLTEKNFIHDMVDINDFIKEIPDQSVFENPPLVFNYVKSPEHIDSPYIDLKKIPGKSGHKRHYKFHP